MQTDANHVLASSSLVIKIVEGGITVAVRFFALRTILVHLA